MREIQIFQYKENDVRDPRVMGQVRLSDDISAVDIVIDGARETKLFLPEKAVTEEPEEIGSTVMASWPGAGARTFVKIGKGRWVADTGQERQVVHAWKDLVIHRPSRPEQEPLPEPEFETVVMLDECPHCDRPMALFKKPAKNSRMWACSRCHSQKAWEMIRDDVIKLGKMVNAR